MEKRLDTGLAAAALAAVVVMAVVRAWLCDDAFISFRAVDQLLAGNGPVYNLGERVQVFTHPLWFGLLALWNGLGASLQPGAIALSLLVFVAGLLATGFAFRDRPLTLAVVLVAMACSRAAMDFATSGLETPLSFALAMGAVFALRTGRHGLAVAVLALMPLNRADLLVWALPFAMIVPRETWRGRIAVLAALIAPAAAWALFSTFYYGSPVPNTALAKLDGAYVDRVDQGLSYITASLLSDPGTFALIAAGLALGLVRWRSDPLVRAGLASLVLSLAYVLWAGGDFMLGRFVLPATWAAIVVVLAAVAAPGSLPRDRGWLAGLLALLAALHALSGQSTLVTHIGGSAVRNTPGLVYHGALDERRFYLPWLGLFPTARLAGMSFIVAPASNTNPEVTMTSGLRAYFAPRERAMVDIWALIDPLLARVRPMPGSRPGHLYRPFPVEYWRWREPAHKLGDARLDAIAADLRLAHRSPELVSAERFAAIVRLLRARSVRLDTIETEQAGGVMNLAIHPARLDRRLGHPGIGAAWINRDCGDSPLRPEGEGFLYLADGDGVVRIRCPAKDFSRIPLWVRAGSLDARGAQPFYLDDAIPFVPERFPWLRQVPSWAVAGWRENPVPAIVVSLLLLASSCVLLLLGRKK